MTHRNALAFTDWAVPRYALRPGDRTSQTFSLTFDLSLFDLFVTWHSGACLCVPAPHEMLQPAGFIDRTQLTLWFSVPSTAILMQSMQMLDPGRFPSLRWSLFCGEALPQLTAASWQRAAPNSTVENLYGPTELTVACTVYRWDADQSPRDCLRGLVPIGEPVAGTQALVVDGRLREVPVGVEGELLLTGPQRTPGYHDAPELNRAAFVQPPGRRTLYYRTGDRVVRARPDAPLAYLGRVDHHVKVGSHDVALDAVEAALRDLTGAQKVVAIGWPRTPTGAEGIIAFISTRHLDKYDLLRRLGKRLPPHMMPSDILYLDRFPLDTQGEIDRLALLERLEKSA